MRFAIITSLFLARRCSRSSNSGEARFSSQPAPRNFGIPREKASGVDPQSRVKTHVPVLGDTCSDGTTWLLSFHSFLPLCLPYFVRFLRARDRASLFEESKKDRQWRSDAIEYREREARSLREFGIFANFLRPKNLWYRIVLDLITRPPVFSRIRYG